MTDSQPAPGRVWWIVCLVFVLFWSLYLSFFGPSVQPPRNAPVLEGTALVKPAEYGWTLSDLDGRPVPFERYRGKTVFLNVWATWCAPCVAELPSIARLARSPALASIPFVCVSVDHDRETARQYLKEKNWPMTFLHASELPPAFNTNGIPATFVIAADGTIVASALGGAEWDDPSVVRFLQRVASARPEPALVR